MLEHVLHPAAGDALHRRRPAVADEVGESPCDVYRFTRGNDRYFLKISSAVLAPTTYSVVREAQVLQWLSGRLNVPEVVQAGANGGGA